MCVILCVIHRVMLCGDIVCRNVTRDGEGCCVVVLCMMVWMKVWVE